MHEYRWRVSLLLKTLAFQHTSLISPHTSLISPVNGRNLHIVTNKHSLLDLLEQSTHTAQQVCTLRTGCRSDIGFIHSDCHKVSFLADDLQAIGMSEVGLAAKPGTVGC